jgi:hypothetical protein
LGKVSYFCLEQSLDPDPPTSISLIV